MWFIGVEVEQETSAPLPKKNPGSAPDQQNKNRPHLQAGRIIICFSLLSLPQKYKLDHRKNFPLKINEILKRIKFDEKRQRRRQHEKERMPGRTNIYFSYIGYSTQICQRTKKKWRRLFLTSSQAELKSGSEAHMTISCTISTHCIYIELRFLNVTLTTLLCIFPLCKCCAGNERLVIKQFKAWL